MKDSEFVNVLIAILVLSLVLGFTEILRSDINAFGMAVIFAAAIILVHVFAKKLMAYKLDAGVEHKLWGIYQYGWKPANHFKKEVPLGAIVPLALTALSLGTLKIMTILTFEATALRRRAAKRFGHYSFTEMTEWHNGLIGAAGIVAILLLSFIAYWVPGLEALSRFAAFYAFFNMIPLSRLDGAQIFFGSKVLWYSLGIITLIFTAYAMLLI